MLKKLQHLKPMQPLQPLHPSPCARWWPCAATIGQARRKPNRKPASRAAEKGVVKVADWATATTVDPVRVATVLAGAMTGVTIAEKTAVRVWAMRPSVPSVKPANALRWHCANWPRRRMAKR